MSAKHMSDKVPVLGVFAAECLEIARTQGVDVAVLLRGVGLSNNVTQLSDRFIELERLELLMRALWQRLPNEALGFEAGLRIPPTAFGAVGLAFISAANLAEGLQIVQRYWRLVGRGVTLLLHVDGSQCVITLKPERSVAPFLAQWMVEAGVASFWRALQSMLPADQGSVRIHLKRKPPLIGSGGAASEVAVIHGGPLDQLVLDAALLDRPFVLHSPHGLHAALRQCEAHLAARGHDEPLPDRVRALLSRPGVGFPSLDQAADVLGLSPRTFRRRLAERGVRYSDLLQEARMLAAIRLLANPALSIASIAGQLGYQDDSNFGRAFRRWAKRSPTSARELLSAPLGTWEPRSSGEMT